MNKKSSVTRILLSRMISDRAYLTPSAIQNRLRQSRKSNKTGQKGRVDNSIHSASAIILCNDINILDNFIVRRNRRKSDEFAAAESFPCREMSSEGGIRRCWPCTLCSPFLRVRLFRCAARREENRPPPTRLVCVRNITGNSARADEYGGTLNSTPSG